MDEALELIEKLGASDDYFERQKAAWALVNLGEAAVDQVAKALENGEFSDLRYKSAWILGKIGSSRGVEPLCRPCSMILIKWFANGALLPWKL
jgi:HEAT repeat protein